MGAYVKQFALLLAVGVLANLSAQYLVNNVRAVRNATGPL
jgi:hypothetical protein